MPCIERIMHVCCCHIVCSLSIVASIVSLWNTETEKTAPLAAAGCNSIIIASWGVTVVQSSLVLPKYYIYHANDYKLCLASQLTMYLGIFLTVLCTDACACTVHGPRIALIVKDHTYMITRHSTDIDHTYVSIIFLSQYNCMNGYINIQGPDHTYTPRHCMHAWHGQYVNFGSMCMMDQGITHAVRTYTLWHCARIRIKVN